jgi:hypothetical protein
MIKYYRRILFRRTDLPWKAGLKNDCLFPNAKDPFLDFDCSPPITTTIGQWIKNDNNCDT